ELSAHHRDDLAAALRGVRLVLVVDVGGGTTDFTLIQVAPSPQGPALRRIAVGDHLMLGGDNMDAALAHRIEQRLALGGKRLGIREWNPLLQSSRVAKESLLGADAPEQYHFSIATEGSGLLKGSRSIELTKTEAEQVVLDGFFPMVGPDEVPQRRDRMALQEVGLPYAQDPAVTRHLAAFLRQHAAAAHAALSEINSQVLPRPDAILLN